jgi:hypothetical protein
MPRANRYFLPGYIWHITHRCHQKEFLLRFDYTLHRVGPAQAVDLGKQKCRIGAV